MAAALAAVAFAAPPGAPAAPGAKPARPAPATAGPGPSVTVAILASGVEPERLWGVPGISPGAMSAGLAEVSAVQTYLDIGAGNRVFTSLYDFEPPVPARVGGRVPGWDEIVRRAESAPAEIVPGLLASTLEDEGIAARADPLLTSPALIAANREGRVRRTAPLECVEGRCPGLAVVPATIAELESVVSRLRGDDLLIAIGRPPPAGAREPRDRDRGSGLRRQPHLRHHPDGRLRRPRRTSRRRSSSASGSTSPMR